MIYKGKSIEIDMATIKYVVFKCNNCCEISWQNLNLWNVNTLNAWFVLKYFGNSISLSKNFWRFKKCNADSVLISFDYKCRVRQFYLMCFKVAEKRMNSIEVGNIMKMSNVFQNTFFYRPLSYLQCSILPDIPDLLRKLYSLG